MCNQESHKPKINDKFKYEKSHGAGQEDRNTSSRGKCFASLSG